MEKRGTSRDKAPRSVFKVGAIALAFLIIGYQSSLFIHRAAALRIAALRDRPDTVYVVDEALARRVLGSGGSASLEMAPEDFASLIPPSRRDLLSPCTPRGRGEYPPAPPVNADAAGPSRLRGHGWPRSPEPSPASASPALAFSKSLEAGPSTGAAGNVPELTAVPNGHELEDNMAVGRKNYANGHKSAENMAAGRKYYANGHELEDNMAAGRKNYANGHELEDNMAAGWKGSGGVVIVRRNAEHSGVAQRERERTRKVETFRFNPNTVSVEDLMRLGFSEKQAMAIDSYRQKGGRFRRASDFAKSYVVADSVFERLAPFIDIPKLDINKADSAAFDALPGIGPYYAAKMVEYRGRLGGYSFKEQLLDIWNFGSERYDGLSDLVVCSRPARPFRLWQMPEDSLRLHPYIRSWQAAHSIVLYRSSMPREQWTVAGLASAGILAPEDAGRLERCFIAPGCE